MDTSAPLYIDETTFLKEHFNLPPLPEAISELQKTIQSEHVSIGKVCEIINNEPSLSANILKIVNSAYYGFANEVDDIKFAIAYLGIFEVYNISLTSVVLNQLDSRHMDEISGIRQHSIFTAQCAKIIARTAEPLLEPSTLWTPAVLHDIGKLVYLKFFPDHYFTLKRYCERTGTLFSDGEKHFGFPASSYVGGILSDRWRLPSMVKYACTIHNFDTLKKSGLLGSKYDFLKIITASNILASVATRQLNEEIKNELINQATRELSINEDKFIGIMAEIYDVKERINTYMW